MRFPRPLKTLFATAASLAALTLSGPNHELLGQAVPQAGEDWEVLAPDLQSLADFTKGQSDLSLAIDRYTEDRAALYRRYDVPFSPVLHQRLRDFYTGWQQQLRAVDFDGLNREGQIDYVLIRNRLEFELAMLEEDDNAVAIMSPLVPFFDELRLLQENRRNGDRPEGRASAQILHDVAIQVRALESSVASGESGHEGMNPVFANRAARWIADLQDVVDDWYRFHAGYDPEFTWWVETAHADLGETLTSYSETITETLAASAASDIVVGLPIGESGLEAHLRHEMIPYTAQQLIDIAEEEFAWMEQALIEASREMGYGDDWRAAQEAVKELAVPPGGKPGVIWDLAQQSREFISANMDITVPPLAREVWRMEMMSPERQLVSPFFLGGEIIRVSYPTNTMEHADKLMSMRGNNPHFNRATVHHELIPGHHLQGFMRRRFNNHRNVFNTPFWGEGWALYWEIILWERDFPRGPEDRIGMLFWRMHRAARIIFSLSYHLEIMTPEEAVELLVDRVGHERANAEAEVRRSFQGNYSPLYQVAYMIGGLQFRALYDELVETGELTEAEFHDAVLQGGVMPVGMVRTRLDPSIGLSRNYWPDWEFSGSR